MKKTILSMSIGFLLLVGCSNENSDTQIDEQTNKLFNVHHFDGENLVWEEISLDEMKSKESKSGLVSTTANKDNSVHAHGDFHGFGGTISFSGTQNNGGTHGSAEIEITSGGGPFGGPSGTAHFILETTSVVMVNVAGEDGAVFGGIVTEVIVNTLPPPPPFPPSACVKYDLGTYVYFLVKDNGQGNNASADQYRSVLVPVCEELSEGGALFQWDFFGFFSWINVGEASDKIKVNY